MKHLELQIYREGKYIGGGQGLGEEGMGSYSLVDIVFQFGKMNGGDGSTTKWRYLIPLYCTLKYS